jgi:hypothetical protein
MLQIFPDMLKWTTYPIYMVQNAIRQMVAKARQKQELPQPHYVELASVMERVLAYAHTGNRKVLQKELLEPLFLYWSLLEEGAPMLNSAIIPAELSGRICRVDHWPLKSDGRPAQSSTASLTYHFGATCAEVSGNGEF